MMLSTWALAARDLKHWYRSRMEMFLHIILPVILLALFGQAFNRLGSSVSPADLSGSPDYVSFMSIGIIGLTVLMTCWFSGISIVMDRKVGFMRKLRATPISRSMIAMSRIWSGVIKGTTQAMVTFGIALLFTVVPGFTGLTLKPDFGVFDFMGMILVIFILAWIFSSFIVMISLATEKPETLAGLINLTNVPIMCVSAVLLPTVLMPKWLEILADCNPLTWASDAMRQFAFNDPAPMCNTWLDILLLVILAVAMVVFCMAAARKLLEAK